MTRYSNFTIRPLHRDFGAEVVDVNIGERLDDATFAELGLAAEHHSLLLLRGQEMDDKRQLALTRRFGEPVVSHLAQARSGRIEHIFHIGNVGSNGEQLPAADQRVVFSTGNQMWHSDSSFRPVPAKFSFSYAYEVTPEGGELEFTSTRRAYAELPEAIKVRLEEAVVIHDYVYSRSKVGEGVVDDSIRRTLPPVRQRLVRQNPVTGDRSLYVGSHARTLEGWEEREARRVLDELNECATTADRVYRHRWQVGDFLIWDNRCLLHRGLPFDADRYRRRMHQSRVACEGPTLEYG